MKQLFRKDREQIMELMKDKKFLMINPMQPDGIETIITKKDVNDILDDMSYSERYAPKVEVSEGGTVFVTYPNNVCTLELI